MKNRAETRAGSNFPKVVFVLFLLLSLHFWDLRFIPKMYNVENLLTWMICGFSFVMVAHKSNMLFRNAIILFIIGLIFNAFASYINLSQDPKASILSYGFYYFILLYFLLHYLELDRKFLENLIIVFGLLYASFFSIQYLIYPALIFNHDVNTAVQEIQLEIIGHGFLMLTYFLLLNRYLSNRKIINIILAVVFLFIQLKSGFRTLFFGALVVSIFMVMRMFKFKAKDFAIVIFIGMVFVGLLQIKGVSDTINGMINKTEKDVNEGSKFNRMVDMEFFFKRYPQNISYFIIGGGKPSGKNLYKFNPEAMGQNYNIVWVDIGILGFYIVIGGIATLGIVWYTLRAIFIKLPEDRLYLNSYFLYLIAVSFTNEEIYRNGIFSVVAIALYLIDITRTEKSEVGDDIPMQELNRG